MKKEFTIEVKGKEWEEALDKAFQKAVKNVSYLVQELILYLDVEIKMRK